MIDMNVTTKVLTTTLLHLAGDRERAVVVKYGTMDARVAMKIIGVEINEKGEVVVLVEA